MSFIKTAFAALALSCTAIAVSAQIATAQGTEVGVLNYAAVERDSKAGKSIQSQLSAIETQLQAEVGPTKTAFDTAMAAIAPKIEGLSQQQVTQKRQADAVFKQEHDDFLQKGQMYEQATQTAQLVVEATRTEALKDFDEVAQAAIQQVAVENGIDIILERKQVMFIQPGADLTAKVVAKLDATHPTIAVTRATNIQVVLGRDGRILGAQAADEAPQ